MGTFSNSWPVVSKKETKPKTHRNTRIAEAVGFEEDKEDMKANSSKKEPDVRSVRNSVVAKPRVAHLWAEDAILGKFSFEYVFWNSNSFFRTVSVRLEMSVKLKPFLV